MSEQPEDQEGEQERRPQEFTDKPGPGQDPDWFEESLIASSAVRLFGRAFAALTIAPDAQTLFNRGQRQAGSPSPFRNPLVDKLDPTNVPPPRLARVFGFSFEGRYLALRVPALFLVHGEGVEVAAGDAIAFQQLGAPSREQFFAANLRVWLYDRSDMTVRLDVGTGTLQEMLIDPEGGGTARRRIDLVGFESGVAGPGPRDIGR